MSQKTNKSFLKRFIFRSGKFKFSHPNKRHLLTKKSSSRKRRLHSSSYLFISNVTS